MQGCKQDIRPEEEGTQGAHICRPASFPGPCRLPSSRHCMGKSHTYGEYVMTNTDQVVPGLSVSEPAKKEPSV